MLNTTDRLALGLWAMDYIETRSITADWRRFGRFGGHGAYYVILHGCISAYAKQALPAGQTSPSATKPQTQVHKAGELWHSDLHVLVPQRLVGDAASGAPIFEQFWAAGMKAHELQQKGWPKAEKQGNVWIKGGFTFDADTALDELIGGSDEKHNP